MPSNDHGRLAAPGDLEIYIPEDVCIQSLPGDVTCIWPVSLQSRGTARNTHRPDNLSSLVKELQPGHPLSFVSSSLAAYKEISRVKLAQVLPGAPAHPSLQTGFKPPTQQDCIIIHREKIYFMIKNKRRTERCGSPSAKRGIDASPCVRPADQSEELSLEEQLETRQPSPNDRRSQNLNGVDPPHEEFLSGSADSVGSASSGGAEAFEAEEVMDNGVQQNTSPATLDELTVAELLQKEKIARIKSNMKARQAQNPSLFL
ncbi:uncharacterized protein ACB058_018400 [Synchiropus picturatus]